MALNPTAREANVIDSIKKYFVDNIYTTEGIAVTFDDSLSQPKVQGSPSEVDRWVGIETGDLELDTLSEFFLEIYVCTRKDNEGFRNAQLRDTIMGYLVDSEGTYTDGMMRIPFYRSVAGGFSNWTLLGNLLIQDVIESGRMKTPDETKFKVLTVRLRFASKV